MNRNAALLVVLLVAPLSACQRGTPAASAGSSAHAQTSPAAASTPAAAAATTRKVARIVFIDLEQCCACTRARIDKSWGELSAVVGFPPVPDVERIHMDSQADKAAPYKKLRPIMVPPAIYFLDAQGGLLQALQGEVTREQVRKILGAR